MQVNSVTNFNYGQSRLIHKAVENPQPEQKPVEDQGVTASLYFTGKDKKGNVMRNATMAGLGSLVLLTTVPPSLSSCSKDDTWASATAIAKDSSSAIATANDTATYYVSTHGKGCNCGDCCSHRDTVYKYIVDRDTIHDTINNTIHDTINNIIHDTIVVDTGSYHVTHDTIVKWMCDWQKPIPLDTLDKWNKKFDIDDDDPSRRNIVYYQGRRDWEYGENFKANANLLESSKNIMVYDREDFDWTGKHTGWGKDVYRIPTSRFTIQTYSGKKLVSPKGLFIETYKNPFDQKSTIYDNDLVQRYFVQTRGDSVDVYSWDPQTGLYREDGRFSKGYLQKNSILLTDLIANDPKIKWGTDPQYSTEDHITNAKTVKLNDEELKLLYIRQRDDEFAEQHYGVCNNK